MIQEGTVLKVIDNTGARVAECFRVYGRKTARIGGIIMVAIKSTTPDSTVKKGSTSKAYVIRTKSTLRRKDGSSISFSDNAIVLIDDKKEPVGKRIKGVVPKELPDNIRKIAMGII